MALRPRSLILLSIAISLCAISTLRMPFRDHFQTLLGKAEQFVNGHAPQVPLHSKPPPVPTNTRPFPPPYSESSQAPQAQAPQAYWSPDFSPHAPVTANFRHETGQTGWGNNEAQNYISSTSNSFHGPNNTLLLRAIIDSSASSQEQKYTSARLTSHQTLSRPRGCVTAHIHAPVARGIWPAFWLLPFDPFTWPYDGEVDIFESWNGDAINHSCLHWGHFNGEDWNKHRVVETPLSSLSQRGHKFDFVWDEDERTGQGRLIWFIDEKPVMKASKPAGTRAMRDFRILLNIAVGGNVCQGQMPSDGQYDMMVSNLAMIDSGPGGWQGFEHAWNTAQEGHAM